MIFLIDGKLINTSLLLFARPNKDGRGCVAHFVNSGFGGDWIERTTLDLNISVEELYRKVQ